MATSIGGPEHHLSDAQVRAVIADALDRDDFDGASVCVVVPDRTRSCPVPLLVEAVLDAIGDRVTNVRILIALGTHAPMDHRAVAAHLGDSVNRYVAAGGTVWIDNHAWWDPATFADLGDIGAAQLAELSGGRLAADVPVRVNRAVLEADRVIIISPVVPHEVVGFSGGTKYLFPGLSGHEMIDVSHWLGALISSAEIIGTPGITPVRALIDEAAGRITTPIDAVCVVTSDGNGLRSVSVGDVATAWASAVEVAAVSHIRRLAHPVRTVVSIIPDRYDDLWTAAKGFYKVEPIVADGGQVILYAPHLTEITPMHPGVEEIGYHVAAYFTGQWDRFAHHPWGELAHSSHLRGAGTWNPTDGEHPRVNVTLATGIDRARTEAVGLDWLDPDEVDLDACEADDAVFVVHDAGEVLYRLGP